LYDKINLFHSQVTDNSQEDLTNAAPVNAEIKAGAVAMALAKQWILHDYSHCARRRQLR
jgi:hypothetical protein